jgi:hypothetical protein
MMSLPGISEVFARSAGLEERVSPELHLFIPYHDRHGILTGHYRWRLYKVRPDGQKYYQEPGSPYVAYFCHLPLEQCETLYLVEGEKKALALREAGFQTIGLPGLCCYTLDANSHPQVLPELHDAIRHVQPRELCFTGDSDTVDNLQYARSGHLLAKMFPSVAVQLVQLPLDGPKGIDDLRGQLNGEFPNWLALLRRTAVPVDPEYSFLVPVILLLRQAQSKILNLADYEYFRHLDKLVEMVATVRGYRHEPLHLVEELSAEAAKATRLTKADFYKAVEERRQQKREEASVAAGTKAADPSIKERLDATQPWPEEFPLSVLLPQVEAWWKKILWTNEANLLVISLYTVFLGFYRESPFRPLLVFTSPEEESGKTTALRLLCRLGHRVLNAISVSSGSVHRVFDYFDANVAIDEAKANILEDPVLITFLNNGFDEESSKVLRFRFEDGEFEEFSSACFKMVAGIGSFLNHDTLSRSFVINLERPLPDEAAGLLDFALCSQEDTEPLARQLLTWINAHRGVFRDLVLYQLKRLPAKFKGRIRQKFAPLFALALCAGPECYRRLERLAAPFLSRGADNRPLYHELLSDICTVLEEQVRLLKQKDPGCKLKMVWWKKREERPFIETAVLITLLLALPEGPWKAYGKNKKMLDANGMFFLLRNYGFTKAERVTHQYRDFRGLFVDDLLNRFNRWKTDSKQPSPISASASSEPPKTDTCAQEGQKPGSSPPERRNVSQVVDTEGNHPGNYSVGLDPGVDGMPESANIPSGSANVPSGQIQPDGIGHRNEVCQPQSVTTHSVIPSGQKSKKAPPRAHGFEKEASAIPNATDQTAK